MRCDYVSSIQNLWWISWKYIFLNQTNTIWWISYSFIIYTLTTSYSVSDLHLKDGPPVQCESELKGSCDSRSVIGMRHLSNRLLGMCEEEFRNKLESILRNLVDKSEAEVRR